MGKDILYPLRRLHGLLIEENIRRQEMAHYKAILAEKKQANPKVVYLVLTPEHTNLGDHAIASEETKLLQSLGIDYIEITGQQLETMQRKKQLGVMNKTPILINGGGNLGTLWFDVEQLMRDIVKANPKSPIFILPNTIFYEDSDYGRKELENSKKLYNSHKRLTFYAREKVSLAVMKNAYNNVKLVPDMVLRRDECVADTNRSGCLICLRNDLEKTVSSEESAVISEQLRQLFGDRVAVTDTHAKQNVPIEQREAALEKKFDEFRGAELVVTDRLHGMIFCAISGTPCIVINSKSPKVKGCYEWIKHLDYIRFVDDVSQITSEYQKIPAALHQYDHAHLNDYFDTLASDILSVF